MRSKIFQFWDHDPPQEIAVLVSSWRAEEPAFQYQLFDDNTGFRLISEEIGSDAAAAYRECGVPAMKADFFRYCVLWLYGGIYIDADTKNLGGLQSLYKKANRGLLFFRQGKIASDFMIVKAAKDPLMRYAIDTAISNIKARTSNNVWLVTGPGILTNLYNSSRNSSPSPFEGYTLLDVTEVRKIVGFTWDLDYKKKETHWTNYKDVSGSPSIFTDNSKDDIGIT